MRNLFPQSLNRLLSTGLFLAGLTVSSAAFAEVEVDHPYARAVPPGQMNSAAFMDLNNKGKEQVALIKVDSSVADKVEMHTHKHGENGEMQMRQIPQITMFGKERVVLKPGGHHIMLIGLKKALAEGDSIDLTLEFDDGTKQELSVPVKSVMAAMGKKHHH
ncbi:copper chaperone PCu(A)C [Aliamphritea ceti]|uniref:copper chaperone PCu(A)C n=1 Tax=Aliamphritea ceti TaxID=1524258 RepID=UPI0021C4993D|nr:copper chaperone PCu(A)C [Aliamphritea ceti]